MKTVAMKLFSCTTLVLLTSMAFAGGPKADKLRFGNEAFKKGDNALNLGLGLGSSFKYYGGVSVMPAFSISYERGIVDNLGPGNLGVGAVLGFTTAYYDYSFGGYQARWTDIVVGARGAYHYNFNLTSKFDPYVGVALGFRIQTYTDTYYDHNNDPRPSSYGGFHPIAGPFVGARYHFAKNLGVFGEVGYGISYLTIGLDIKF